MATYSELIKKFREKNSKPNTGWRYESWGNPLVERIGMKPGGLVEPGVVHYAKKGGADYPGQGFEKGNVWYKQNIGKYKTDIVRLRKLRQTLDNLEKGSTLSLNKLHTETGVSRRTIDNILMKEYKGKFDIPGMGKAQSLNIQKYNLKKLAQPVGIPTPFPKSDLVKWPNEEIKNKYVRDLKTKYTFPSGSPDAAKVSNSALAKKYFGKVNQATIGKVERINNILSRDLKLTYPKVDPKEFVKKRLRRLDIVQGGKYIGGTDKFPFHHIMPIGGETPITTKDVTTISKQMNSKLAPYNKKLNDIADAVSDHYTNRSPGFQKRIDELHKNAEQIINKVKKELPKKYQGLIGFTKLEPIYDEYGTILRLHGNRVGVDDAKSIAGVTGKAEEIGEMTGKRLSEFKKFKSFKDVLRNNYAGAAELTYAVLKKGKFNRKICKTKFANGGGGLCGEAFKNKYPQQYLIEVSKTPGAEELLKSEKGLNFGRSVLDNAKKIRASKTVARIGSWTNPLSLIGGEIWYSYLAGHNEWTKGASMFESINEGLWFIPGKESRDIEDLLGPDYTRREEGRMGKVIPDELRENYYKLIEMGHIINKNEELQSKLSSQHHGIMEKEEKIKNMQMKARFVDRDALGRPMENKLNIMQEDLDTLKFVEGSIADQVNKNSARGQTVFEGLTKAGPGLTSVGKLQDKIKDRIVDKFHKKRTWGLADPYSGEEWNWMKRNLWERPAGALDMSDQALIQRQKRLDEITKDSPNWKELEKFWEQETGGKGLTIYDKRNLPPELIENFLVKYPWADYLFEDQYSRQQQAGGGLANLTRTVAPDSGPVSRGLRSLYIDDMD